jgi:hypothetical protein
VKRKPTSYNDFLHVVAAVKHPELDDMEKHWLLALAIDSSPVGTNAHPGYEALRERVDRTDDMQRRYGKHCESLGLIVVKHGKGKGNANTYTFRLENPAYPDEYKNRKPALEQNPECRVGVLVVKTPNTLTQNPEWVDPKPRMEDGKTPNVGSVLSLPSSKESIQPTIPAQKPEGWETSCETLAAMGELTTEHKRKLEALIAPYGDKGWDLLTDYVSNWKSRPEGLGGLRHPWGIFTKKVTTAMLDKFIFEHRIELYMEFHPEYKALADAQFKDGFDKKYGLGKYSSHEQVESEGDPLDIFKDDK